MAKPTDIVKTASMSAAILDAGTATAAPDAQPIDRSAGPLVCARQLLRSNRSSRGRSSAFPLTCPSIALDYYRTSLCTWSRRSNMSALCTRFAQRRYPLLRPCRIQDLLQLLCSSLQCLLCSSRSRSPKDGRRDFLCLLCNQVASPARTFTARRLRQKRIIPLIRPGLAKCSSSRKEVGTARALKD